MDKNIAFSPAIAHFSKEKSQTIANNDLAKKVEIKRFELLTPCLQSRCSTN